MTVLRSALVLLLAAAGGLMGCSRTAEEPMKQQHVAFGKTPDGQEVTLYTLRNTVGHGSEDHELRRHHRGVARS